MKVVSHREYDGILENINSFRFSLAEVFQRALRCFQRLVSWVQFTLFPFALQKYRYNTFMPRNSQKSLIEKIARYSPLFRGKSVVVACSGGPDSMVLLDLLRTHVLHATSIIAAHVNHQLRESAKRDEKIVHDYCEKYDIPLEVLTVDIKK